MRISVCESLPTSPDLRKLAKERGEDEWVTLGRLVYVYAYIARQTIRGRPITDVTPEELGIQLMNDSRIIKQLMDCGYLLAYEGSDEVDDPSGIDTNEKDMIYSIRVQGED